MTCPTPRTYWVLSPETMTFPGDELEPPEYGRFVDEVQATSKREAIRVAYADPKAEIHEWAKEARGDGRHPFSGVTVEHPHCEHDVCPDTPVDDDGFNCEGCRVRWAEDAERGWVGAGP